MSTVHAIFENGVFRPCAPVQLPDGCEVEFDPHVVGGHNGRPGMLAAVYEVLSRRFDSGESNVSARHNEHQP